MKMFVLIISLISLLGLLAQVDLKIVRVNADKKDLKSEFPDSRSHSNVSYSFKIKIDADRNLFKAQQEITWKNITHSTVNRIYFYLPINAFENPNTEFAKNFELDKENFTKIDFYKITINNKPVELKYLKGKKEFNSDRTLALVDLALPVAPDSTLKIYMDYTIQIPKSFKNFGYAPGNNYFVFDNFYPRVAVYNNQEWILNQVHSYSEQPEDYADYYAEINLPDGYKIISNAFEKFLQENKNEKIKHLTCLSKKGFYFSLSKEHIQKKIFYESQNGKSIEINIALRESREKYFDRVKKSLINSIEYLEKNIGEFPFSSLQVIDVNHASYSSNVSVPGLIRISIDLFSLQSLRKIEQDISYLTVKQYFENSLMINETYDSWINEGISSYISDKIYEKYFAQPCVYFDFVSYYPILGLNLLSYNEIPLIYSIGKINYPVEYKNLNTFYENLLTLAINDSSFKISSDAEYFIINRLKAKLFLMSIERQNSSAYLIKNLKDFYLINHSKIINTRNFIDFITERFKNQTELITSLLNNENTDSKILSARKIDQSKYEIILSKNTSSPLPIDLQINTEKSSIRKLWKDEKFLSKMIIESKDEITSIIIDPERKYISDINFSNNSYVMENKYWGSLSLAIRAFFWFQNALLMMGSI